MPRSSRQRTRVFQQEIRMHLTSFCSLIAVVYSVSTHVVIIIEKAMRDVIELAPTIRRCGFSASLLVCAAYSFVQQKVPVVPARHAQSGPGGVATTEKKVVIRPISSKGKTRRRRRVAPAIVSHHHPPKLRALGFRETELKRALAAGYLGLILQQQSQLSSENRIGQE
ncbi:uncharacterized protein LY79DRAFT_185123 [Colletotrichum navitas]|uniref:Uncharacterized protein n=1 Tax=Colletotrichum navitas TaxID=681940 RepID=A0AAD8Q0Q3_9PEZI|nr:uncharacterized protein LY79DRAFT_185123 [Colletotrichum navitas]KAK1593349.1 hypothetical protein LY79DRAFT_185123 [Colletotrichum navitas]